MAEESMQNTFNSYNPIYSSLLQQVTKSQWFFTKHIPITAYLHKFQVTNVGLSSFLAKKF